MDSNNESRERIKPIRDESASQVVGGELNGNNNPFEAKVWSQCLDCHWSTEGTVYICPACGSKNTERFAR